ncbi:MAG TPA: DUF3999 domain-containing protein [Gammaproteobacteria bacterium]|nr:DUF3999 domain-containing protein [Gammaproteobacteria bacterium]
MEEFAYGFIIDTDGSAAIYKVALPEKIYRTVTRDDLGDIRVFNNSGRHVPHAIRRQETRQTEESIRVKLPFFPLHGDLDSESIRIGEDGTIQQIKPEGNGFVTESANIASYLIDLSKLDKTVDELEIDLVGKEGGYIKRAHLESSNDLQKWQTVTANAVLSDLDYGDHTLTKNIIELPNRKFQYLRFTWWDQGHGLQIKSVKALLKTINTQKEHHRGIVEGVQSKKDDKIYEFNTGGVFPIEQVDIILPEDNTLIEGTLKSRDNPEAEWRTHYSGVFYSLNMRGSKVDSGGTSVKRTTDRYWQLETKTDGGIGPEPPKLEFAWLSNDLYFLARGQGPFTLAYGNAAAEAPGRPIDALMRVLSDNQQASLIEAATLGEAVTLKGEEALVPRRVIPSERILLWAVLVIGVIVIIVMVVRLFRQMNTPG